MEPAFYCRTRVDAAFDGVIRVRRYLCRSCKRTVSLLPEFAFPWRRFSVSVIALFLVARLLNGLTLAAAARAAAPTGMPYQRGQFWVRPGGASHWPPRAPPPEGPHRAFAWRKTAAPGYRSGTEIFPWMPKPKNLLSSVMA